MMIIMCINATDQTLLGITSVDSGFLRKLPILSGGPLMVAHWLRYCATNRKAAGSIPDGVNGIFH
jgi:hypothetical protein